MSDSELFLEEGIPEKIVPPRGIERVLKGSVALLSAILLLELVWFAAVLPCLPLRSVKIGGDEGIQRTALLSAAGIAEGTSFLTFDAAAAKRGMESLAEIESVQVVRQFPESLSIAVVKREAVAVALASFGGKSVPVSIDRNGVVFRIGGRKDGAGIAGPIVSGLQFENPQAGIVLPAFLHPLVADIARLRAESPALLDAISEIRVVKKAYDAYELVLFPAYRPVRVKIGSQLNEDTLRYMMLVLDVLASKGIETDELDFRTGTAAYRTKGG